MTLLFLALIRLSWDEMPGAESYRVYLERGYGWEVLAKVRGNSVDLDIDGGGVVAVTSVSGDFESAFSDGVVLPDVRCAEKVLELRRVCGKKCSKVR